MQSRSPIYREETPPWHSERLFNSFKSTAASVRSSLMSLGERVVPREEGHMQDARLAAAEEGEEGCVHSLY